MTAEMFADQEGQALVAAIHERKGFDYNAPLPPLKQHPQERLWEPAAVRFRDLPGGGCQLSAETCRVCEQGQQITFQPDESIPLCNAHWNRWLARFLGDDNAPCAAHVIREGRPSE